MYGRKSKKLDKETKKKQRYISYYKSRKKKYGKPPKNTWTYAQWRSSGEKGKQSAKSGISYKTYKRMGGK